MTGTNIRQVEKKDEQVLASIIRAVFTEYDAPKAGTVYADPSTDTLFELFKTPKSLLFVAETDGKLVGCCGIYPTEGLPNSCTEIVKFYLAQSSRGKGIGKALYAACEWEAQKLGYSELYIESIPAFATAIGIYESLGFKALAAPLGNSGHFGCDIWLLKTL